jgi:hypothetical protein
MGKTSFIENQLIPFFSQIQKSKFITFSSDQIRRKLMDDFLNTYKGKTENDAFNASS